MTTLTQISVLARIGARPINVVTKKEETDVCC
jgi:hypothetical protein